MRLGGSQFWGARFRCKDPRIDCINVGPRISHFLINFSLAGTCVCAKEDICMYICTVDIKYHIEVYTGCGR
jgi:hypothetical protein